jgi:hypothetical protein
MKKHTMPEGRDLCSSAALAASFNMFVRAGIELTPIRAKAQLEQLLCFPSNAIKSGTAALPVAPRTSKP